MFLSIEHDLALDTQWWRQEMRFDEILESNGNVGKKLIGLIVEFNGHILCPLSWVLGVHMILNVVVTKWGRPSLYDSG